MKRLAGVLRAGGESTWERETGGRVRARDGGGVRELRNGEGLYAGNFS